MAEQEAQYKAPEMVKRAGDGKWLLWVWGWRPLVLDSATAPPEAWRKWDFESPWIASRRCWVPAGVYGTAMGAARAAQDWERRNQE